jgi:hypothetical protein
MKRKIFINIDSTYRDRVQYPNPADFQITTNGTVKNSLDFFNIDYERCYSIELVSLTLPNVILQSGYGNRIAFYPYVYVEFSNMNQPCKNIMWSNNPNSTNCLFKVPMYNINTPDISKFVRVDGRGMTQSIVFRARDSFRLRVLLPNGEIFQTDPDTIPPLDPTEDLQISYTFSLLPV